MSELELRHLRMLFENRARVQQRLTDLDTELEDFVLEMRDSGASARGMAEALGVGPSTIQTWTSNARARRLR